MHAAILNMLVPQQVNFETEQTELILKLYKLNKLDLWYCTSHIN